MSVHEHLAPLPGFLRRRPWASGLTTILIFGIGAAVFLLTRPKTPTYITAVATRGNLMQTVEAVGTVISEKDLELQFPVSGIVGQVFVQEGDHVQVGQKLAALRAASLAADSASALARVKSAEAELQALVEGTRPEDIAIAEAEVANKRAALEAAQETLAAAQLKLAALRDEAATSLEGHILTSKSSAEEQLSTAETAFAKLDDVLSDSDVQDAMNRGDTRIPFSKDTVQDGFSAAHTQTAAVKDSPTALHALEATRAAVTLTATAVDQTFNTISSLTTSNVLTASDRETLKSTLALQRSNVQSALRSLDTAIKDLKDASAGFETKIVAEESTIAGAKGDMRTYETALRTQEAELLLKKAGTRKADLDASAARVQGARADLARAQAAYADTILTAPIEGLVTKVNLKAGESLSRAFQTDPAVTLLGAAPYRIEVFVSEVDIPHVALAQTGSVVLDAFPGIPETLHVGEIDRTATDRDGVSKYRVKLDPPVPPDAWKIGMAGDVTIITGMRENVVKVQTRAVLQNANGENIVRILGSNGTVEERRVEKGMEGGSTDEVEILQGLSGGERIILLIKQ